jgi:hypothetical protein
MADAYNAQMRYAPKGGHSGSALGSTVIAEPGYEQVPQLKTQDQEQMDLLRDAQKQLQQYELGEESFFQQDQYGRKMSEMEKLVGQDYQQRFFDANEQMRRISSLFDSWKEMNEQEFQEVLTKIGIPAAWAGKIRGLLRDNKYVDAAFMMQERGFTVPAVDQIAKWSLASNVLSDLIKNPNQDPQTIAQKLGRLDGDFMIGKITGAIDAAKASGGFIGEAVSAAEELVGQLLELGGWTVKNIKTIALTAGGAALIGVALPFILKIVSTLTPVPGP